MTSVEAADRINHHATRAIADHDLEAWLWMQTEEFESCCGIVGLEPQQFRVMVRHARDVAREPVKLRRVK